MAKEATLWDWLSSAMVRAQNLERMHQRVERIESGVSFGVPDVNFTIEGCEGWIELKATDLPVRDTTRVLPSGSGLRTEQIAWHVKAQSCGTRSFILVKAGEMRWLLGGDHAMRINVYNREQMTLCALWSLRGPACNEDCQQLRDTLMSHKFNRGVRVMGLAK